MSSATEAFARVKIDALLKDASWEVTDGASVLFEHTLADGSRADYVLCDRAGRPMAALEAKHAGIDPITAQDQGRHYAAQLEVPFAFLSNGEEVWFLDRETDAHARKIAGFYSPDDLERRIAARRIRRDLATAETDRRIVDRDYQIECIEALCAEISLACQLGESEPITIKYSDRVGEILLGNPMLPRERWRHNFKFYI